MKTLLKPPHVLLTEGEKKWMGSLLFPHQTSPVQPPETTSWRSTFRAWPLSPVTMDTSRCHIESHHTCSTPTHTGSAALWLADSHVVSGVTGHVKHLTGQTASLVTEISKNVSWFKTCWRTHHTTSRTWRSGLDWRTTQSSSVLNLLEVSWNSL